MPREKYLRVDESSDMFIAEKILGKKMKRDQPEYLIKWLNYSTKEATWEPIKNLTSIWDMVEEYEESCKKRKDKPNQNSKKVILKHSPYEESKDTFSNKCKEKPRLCKEKYPISKNSIRDSEESQKRIPNNGIGDQIRSKKNPQRESEKHSKISNESQSESHSDIELEKEFQEIAIQTNIPEGSFENGDRPKKILNCYTNLTGEVFITLEWYPRTNGVHPIQTVMATKELLQHDSDLLINFYESRLKFIKKSRKELKKVKFIESSNDSEIYNEKIAKLFTLPSSNEEIGGFMPMKIRLSSTSTTLKENNLQTIPSDHDNEMEILSEKQHEPIQKLKINVNASEKSNNLNNENIQNNLSPEQLALFAEFQVEVSNEKVQNANENKENYVSNIQEVSHPIEIEKSNEKSKSLAISILEDSELVDLEIN